MTDFDATTRDAIRDLCEAVAILAQRCVHLIGVADATDVVGKAMTCSQRMDDLDLHDETGDLR